MCKPLIVLGLVVLALGLRSSRTGWLRKLGAVTFLGASFCLAWFLTGRLWAGFLGVAAWFFLPWIELLTRIRRLRLPLNNRLRHRPLPDPAFFPNAVEATHAMEEAGFEHVTDCGWDWAGMQQFFRLFWHPEEMAVAAVCLCEQSEVAFAFISVTSYDENGRTWRTTNYPFSPTLKCTPGVRWNHVPCERACFHRILRDHKCFLSRAGVGHDDLRMPDPDELEGKIEGEMQAQVKHNLDAGIIRLTEDGHFQYSRRGLLFLWGQFVKDMLRLC
ncbi:hypothetical protein KBB96_16960 [Luteolibacter ambystomatis]|uniref:Uncharacterized protein n=1 Tax=Luteolibacter ambystomatis TaxID=2824561 RepID=A0A975G855_9BACT|nr:hypothetical protein [Luteolibacter ambystomatis]QUE50541.1 hypothetical protein KBB96_16960 [Luteolibacter ambystomatis]